MSDTTNGATQSEPPAKEVISRRSGRMRWMLRRLWQWSSWGVTLLALLVVGFAWWTDHQGAKAIESLRRTMANHHIPTTLDAWRLRYGKDADHHRDGTHLYRAAMAAARLPFEVTEHLPHIGLAETPMPTIRMDADTAAALTDFVTRQQHIWALIDRARDHDRFHFEFLQLEQQKLLQFDLLSDVRRLARLLCVRSLHAQAVGDADMATASLLSMLHLSQALETEPTLIMELIRISIDVLAIRAIEDTLSRLALEDAHLESLQKALQARQDGVSLARVLQGELLYGCLWVSDRNRLISEVMASRAQARELFDTNSELFAWMSPHTWDRGFRIWVSLFPGWLEKRAVQQVQPSLDAYDMVLAAQDDWPALAQRVQPPAQDDGGYDPHGLVRAGIRTALDARATRHIALTALLVERFRLVHDRWPHDLEEVERWSGQTLPDDPFTGNRLRYRVAESGVFIDRVKADARETVPSPHEPHDVRHGFRLYAPSVRNQPRTEGAPNLDRQSPESHAKP